MIYNFNHGIGWASSGVEYAQVYRANVLRRINEPAKFIFTDMFQTENIEQLSKNIGFEDEEVMWLYTSLFTDVKIAPPSYTLDMLMESLGADNASIQTNKKAVKIFLNDNGDYAMAFRANEDSEFIHRVEIVVADKLIRKDYFTYCKIFTEYYAPLNGKAHLYMRRFFNEDGTVAYDEITDDESVVFKFPDNIFYSKEELIAEFVRRLKLTSEDLVIVDRTTGMGQSIIQNARPAKIGIVIHADHFSEGNTNDDNILWNNYYEYSFTNNSKIDFYIASTEAQKELVQEQFKKYNGVCPEVFAIPVGSVDELKYSDNRKSHSVITASRLAGEKHIEWIVDAVVEARKTIEDITLDIYGKGGEEDKLKEQIEKYGAGEYIKLCGHQNLADIYKQYELYVSASSGEGFGLTLLEAIASGLPLIGFDVRYGNQTFIDNGKNGFLVDFEVGVEPIVRTKRMADAIVKLFNECDMSQCQKVSYDIAEGYLTEKVEERWKQLIAWTK